MRTALLLVLIAALGGCGQQSTTPGATVDVIELPADNVGEGVETRFTNQGVVTAIMHSDTAFWFARTRRVEMRGVNVSFRDDRGAEAGVLTSTAGEYAQDMQLFIARGDVVLITEGANGPRRLETEELRYDIRGDRIWTDVPFTVVEAGRTTRGSAFRSDSQFRTWEVTGVQTQGSPGETGISF